MENVKLDWTQTDADTYGNPRYVLHFLAIDLDFDRALKIAKTVGGTKYRAKWYGGGIVFTTYCLEDTEKRLLDAIRKHNG